MFNTCIPNRNSHLNKLKIPGFLGLCLSIAHFYTNPAQAGTPATANISVDGKLIKTTYYLQNGSLMVPDIFFKNTGATVDFNQQYQSIAVERKNIVALPLEKAYIDYYLQDRNQWFRDYLTTTTTKINGQTYIPLLVTAQKLGMTVTYDPKIQRTYIRTNTPAGTIPPVFSKGKTTLKKIALTFDDGPDMTYTPRILNILRQKQAKATFFVIGEQVSNFPEAAERIVNEGHTIASHSWDHVDLSKVYTSQVIQKVTSTNTLIEKITGRRPVLFRFPYGEFTAADALTIKKLGLRNIYWTIDTLDWSGKTAAEIMEIINREKSPGDIILMYSFQSANLEGAVQALPKIIDQLRAEGYELVTVDNLISS
jgi:peptidoglycan/xylan/chitin deacetylase (PgdA/CDA1 family)